MCVCVCIEGGREGGREGEREVETKEGRNATMPLSNRQGFGVSPFNWKNQPN